MKIVPSDINGVAAIMPTPSTADADKWSSRNTINIDEVRKMVPLAHKKEVNLIMTTGTFGEMASLMKDELIDFVDAVVQENRQKVPVFAGVTTMNTRETIEWAKELISKVAIDGLFLGRPFWLPLDDAGIVNYYKDMAEAFPGVPLIVYDNPIAFKGKISTNAYRELAKIPEIIAAKHTGGPSLIGDVKAVEGKMKILPIDEAWLEPARELPDEVTACWTGNIASAPDAVSALGVAIKNRDWERAEYVTERLHWAQAPQFPDGDLAKFMPYSIQIGHARFKGAGLIDPGPGRPPYAKAPQSFIDGGLEAGRRLREIQIEFSQK